jgi:hypothetical protein
LSAELSISDRLAAAGYGHRKNPNEIRGGRIVYSLATGEPVGAMDVSEAIEFLEKLDEQRSAA